MNNTPYSLKNHGVDFEVNEMFDMGFETMKLPMDEKLKYEQGDDGMSFGFVFVTFRIGRSVIDFHADIKQQGRMRPTRLAH